MKTIFKYIYIIIGLTLSHYAYASTDKETYFESKNYIVYLDTSKCTEYSIKCDVTYHGINKHNHHKVTAKGSTLNIGPYLDFRGYIFHKGKYDYTLIPSDDDEGGEPWSVWVLAVDVHKSDHQDDETIVEEKGKWVDPK